MKSIWKIILCEVFENQPTNQTNKNLTVFFFFFCSIAFPAERSYLGPLESNKLQNSLIQADEKNTFTTSCLL